MIWAASALRLASSAAACLSLATSSAARAAASLLAFSVRLRSMVSIALRLDPDTASSSCALASRSSGLLAPKYALIEPMVLPCW